MPFGLRNRIMKLMPMRWDSTSVGPSAIFLYGRNHAFTRMKSLSSARAKWGYGLFKRVLYRQGTPSWGQRLSLLSEHITHHYQIIKYRFADNWKKRLIGSLTRTQEPENKDLRFDYRSRTSGFYPRKKEEWLISVYGNACLFSDCARRTFDRWALPINDAVRRNQTVLSVKKKFAWHRSRK